MYDHQFNDNMASTVNHTWSTNIHIFIDFLLYFQARQKLGITSISVMKTFDQHIKPVVIGQEEHKIEQASTLILKKNTIVVVDTNFLIEI